jgi:hypothetical protein
MQTSNAFVMRHGNGDGFNIRPISGTGETRFALVDPSNAIRAALVSGAANLLELRNGTNAQTFNIYNTYTDTSNYERGFLKWNSNTLQIGTEALGTGTGRSVTLTTASGRYLTLSNATTLDTNAVYMRFYSSTTVFANVNADTKTISVGSNGQYVFTSGLDSFGTVRDTGIARESAGVLKVTNGSTGNGALSFGNAQLLSETATLATTTATQIAAFPATFLGAKLIIQAADTVSGARQISELLLVHDGTTVTVTEFGIVYTNASLATYTAEISGSDIIVKATSASTNNTVYKVMETLL